MKKQEMTTEERKAAIAKLESKKALLQAMQDNLKAAEEVRTEKRREHRMALEEEASRILSEALPPMPNAGNVVASVAHEWSLGEVAKMARLKIGRPESREHDFEVTIKDGNLHGYSAWSQGGSDTEDARETIAYYEIVATTLSFVCNPENKETLDKLCEIVNTPYVAEDDPPQGLTVNDVQAEIQGIDADIRKLKIYVGAIGQLKRPKSEVSDFVVAKVTPKTFTYRVIINGEQSKWTEAAKIGDNQYTFDVAA